MSAHTPNTPNYNEEHIPLAYLITFRCYGTWLHGDERGSIDRHNNQYRSPLISPNRRWKRYNQRMLKHLPVRLSKLQRSVVEFAIDEACNKHSWLLLAVNARTNHIHSVVSASCHPGIVLNALKSYATRKMRESGCWLHNHSPWSDKGSKRYLWTKWSVKRAINYVINGQDNKIQGFNDDDDSDRHKR